PCVSTRNCSSALFIGRRVPAGPDTRCDADHPTVQPPRSPATTSRRLALLVTLCLLATACGDLVEVRPLRDVTPEPPTGATTLVDASGATLATLDRGRLGTPVPLRRIARHARQAVIAIEDARFRRHGGLD